MCKKNIDSIAHLKGEVKRDDSRTALRLKSSLRIVSCIITLSGDGNEKSQKKSIGLSSKQLTLHVQHTFFTFLFYIWGVSTGDFVRTKISWMYFYMTKIFLPMVLHARESSAITKPLTYHHNFLSF